MTLRLEARQRTPAWMNVALPVAAIVAALLHTTRKKTPAQKFIAPRVG